MYSKFYEYMKNPEVEFVLKTNEMSEFFPLDFLESVKFTLKNGPEFFGVFKNGPTYICNLRAVPENLLKY